MFRTIGPVWDGNEVWLVVAGGATFAAFPAWYATMFSGFYIALLLLLVLPDRPRGLVRVAREERELALARALGLGEHDRQPRRCADLGCRASRTCSTACRSTRAATSPATSGTSSTSTPCSAGVAVVLLFAFHGATYLTLRTTGELCRRAAAAAGGLSIAAAVVGAGVPDLDRRGRGRPQRQGRLPAAAARAYSRSSRSSAPSSACGSRAAAGRSCSRRPAPSSSWRRSSRASTRASWSRATTSRNSLTVDNASSAHYTLKVMTVVALIVTPLILLYQALDVPRLPREDHRRGGAAPRRRERRRACRLARPLTRCEGSTPASSVVHDRCGRCSPWTPPSGSRRRCSSLHRRS